MHIKSAFRVFSRVHHSLGDCARKRKCRQLLPPVRSRGGMQREPLVEHIRSLSSFHPHMHASTPRSSQHSTDVQLQVVFLTRSDSGQQTETITQPRAHYAHRQMDAHRGLAELKSGLHLALLAVCSDAWRLFRRLVASVCDSNPIFSLRINNRAPYVLSRAACPVKERGVLHGRIGTLLVSTPTRTRPPLQRRQACAHSLFWVPCAYRGFSRSTHVQPFALVCHFFQGCTVFVTVVSDEHAACETRIHKPFCSVL